MLPMSENVRFVGHKNHLLSTAVLITLHLNYHPCTTSMVVIWWIVAFLRSVVHRSSVRDVFIDAKYTYKKECDSRHLKTLQN